MPATEAIRFPTSGPTNRNRKLSCCGCPYPRAAERTTLRTPKKRLRRMNCILRIFPSGPSPWKRRGLLKRATHLQQTPVVMMARDDLDSHGQAFGGETARDRQCRIAHDRNVVAGLHPVDIGGELNTGDFGNI